MRLARALCMQVVHSCVEIGGKYFWHVVNFESSTRLAKFTKIKPSRNIWHIQYFRENTHKDIGRLKKNTLSCTYLIIFQCFIFTLQKCEYYHGLMWEENSSYLGVRKALRCSGSPPHHFSCYRYPSMSSCERNPTTAPRLHCTLRPRDSSYALRHCTPTLEGWKAQTGNPSGDRPRRHWFRWRNRRISYPRCRGRTSQACPHLGSFHLWAPQSIMVDL